MTNTSIPETMRHMDGDQALTLVLSTLLGIAVSALLWLTAGPLLSSLNSLLGLDTQDGLWYLTRAAGLVAYLLMWLSTVWGLAVASKVFDPVLHRAFTFDAHEWLSLLAIGFTVLHVGALLVDAYMPFSLVQVLVPFVNSYRPFWVGVGVVGMYLSVLVTVTFYIRRWIGQKTFRAIHLQSFVAYASITAHSLFAGTDTALVSTKVVYAATALVVLCLTVYWYVVTRLRKPAYVPAKVSQ